MVKSFKRQSKISETETYYCIFTEVDFDFHLLDCSLQQLNVSLWR